MTVLSIFWPPGLRTRAPWWAGPARIIGAWARRLLLLGTLATLTGCSAVKLGYNSAPDLVYWWVDGYLDLNDIQTQRVREDITTLHRWHRATELPRLAELLDRAAQQASGPVTAPQVCATVDALRERFTALTDQAEPAMMALATSLTPSQLRHLEKRYARNVADYRKEWVDLTPQELSDKRLKAVLERSEMIYGRLDEPQRQAIRQQLALSSFNPATSLAEQQRRHRDALQTLRRLVDERPAPAAARELMRGLLARSIESPDPTYRAYAQKLLQEGCDAFAIAHNTTTAAQRETAARRLRAYARDFRDLASQS